MKSDSKKANASNGSLAWSVSADEVSWILGEFEPYFKNYVMNSRFGVTEESYLFDFRDTGKLPNLGTETLPEFGTELTEEEISLMDEQELDALFEKLLQIACVRHPYDRVHRFDEALLTQPEMKREFVLAIIRQLKRIFRMKTDRKTGAIPHCAAAVSLRPAKADRSGLQSAGISRIISAIPDVLRDTGMQSILQTQVRSFPIWIGSAMRYFPR